MKFKRCRVNKFNTLYDELVMLSKNLLLCYDIDKVKSHSVYVWSKGEEGENVFDIMKDKIVFYIEDHVIAEAVKPTIKKIQLKLQEIDNTCVE